MSINKIAAFVFVAILSKFDFKVNAIIPEKETNLYHNINGQLQETIYVLFTMLKLDNNFIDNDQRKILLLINAKMKTLTENYFTIYKEIRQSVKSDPDSPRLDILNFTIALNELTKEGDILNQSILHQNRSILDSDLYALEVPTNFEELIKDFKAYFIKNNISLDANNNNDDSTKFSYSIIRNLKAWKTANESEELGSRRMFMGKRVKIRKFPFVASIHVYGEFECVGSIISLEMVITAASCLQIAYEDHRRINEKPWDFSIRVGSDFADKHGEWVYASNIIFHPEYDPETLSNNLAIIYTKSYMNLRKKNKKIRRIEYQNVERELTFPDEYGDIKLIGFGGKEDEPDEQQKLMSTKLNLYDTENCAKMYTRKYVSDNNFCATYVTKASGACERDVGSPAIVNHTLVGFVSLSPPICGSPEEPSVFINLKSYVNWINKMIEEHPKRSQEIYSNEEQDKNLHDANNTETKVHLNSYSSIGRQQKQIDLIETSSQSIQTLPQFVSNNQSLKESILGIQKDYTETFNKLQPISPQPKMPKAFKLIRNILRKFVDYYGPDEFYDINDNHLWNATTIAFHDHPLINNSFFVLQDLGGASHARFYKTTNITMPYPDTLKQNTRRSGSDNLLSDDINKNTKQNNLAETSVKYNMEPVVYIPYVSNPKYLIETTTSPIRFGKNNLEEFEVNVEKVIQKNFMTNDFITWNNYKDSNEDLEPAFTDHNSEAHTTGRTLYYVQPVNDTESYVEQSLFGSDFDEFDHLNVSKELEIQSKSSDDYNLSESLEKILKIENQTKPL